MSNVERFASSGIGLRRFAFAEVLNLGNATTKPTYGPIYLCDGLVSADLGSEEEPEVHFVGNKRWRYNPSYLSIEKTALTPEYQKIALGQTLADGVLEKRLSDESPVLALLWETEQANGKRVRWLLPCARIISAEPTSLETKGEGLTFQHFTLSCVYWHTFTGVKYRRAYEELDAAQFANWFTAIQI